MHTASYEFLMKPKESAGCHQTLSARVGSGDETRAGVGLAIYDRKSKQPQGARARDEYETNVATLHSACLTACIEISGDARLCNSCMHLRPTFPPR